MTSLSTERDTSTASVTRSANRSRLIPERLQPSLLAAEVTVGICRLFPKPCDVIKSVQPRSIGMKSRNSSKSDSARQRAFDAVVEVAPPIYTATGPIKTGCPAMAIHRAARPHYSRVHDPFALSVRFRTDLVPTPWSHLSRSAKAKLLTLFLERSNSKKNLSPYVTRNWNTAERGRRRASKSAPP